MTILTYDDGRQGHATDIGAMLEAIRIIEACDDATVGRLVFEICSTANRAHWTERGPEDFFIQTLNGRFRQDVLKRIFFIAMKRISPTLETGFDFSDEYRKAYAKLAVVSTKSGC